MTGTPRMAAVRDESAIGGRVDVPSNPELANAEIPQHRGQSAEMIFVAMGERDDINAFQAPTPKIGRDHVFANVDAGAVAVNVRAARQSAAVHQHRPAVGKSHENGIALPDIENGNLEAAARQAGRKGMRGDQNGENQPGRKRYPLAADGGGSKAKRKIKCLRRRTR